MEKQPIRVLQIIGIVCGGGVEAVVMNYYRHIDRSKIQFDFIVDGKEKSILDDEIESLGGIVYHVTSYKKNVLRFMKDIHDVLSKNSYDIVHSHMNTLSFFALAPAWMVGIRTRIIHNHSTSGQDETARKIVRMTLRLVAPVFANQYFACGKYAADWLYGNNCLQYRECRVNIVNNAIALEEFAFHPEQRSVLRRKLDLKQDAVLLGHVGRFVPLKNHTFLLQILRSVKEAGKDAHLLLIGDGPCRNNVEREAVYMNLSDRVHFLGLIRNVKDWYNAMDIFLLPSWYEGLPVVAVEAQANGLPCCFSSHVTVEAKLTQSAEFLPIEQGTDMWVERILSGCAERNEGAVKEMSAKGFSIQTEAEKLCQMYLKYGSAQGI